jgi:hypothetical protein
VSVLRNGTGGGQGELSKGLVSVEGLLDGERGEVEVGDGLRKGVGWELSGLRKGGVALVGAPHGSSSKDERSKRSRDLEGNKGVEVLEAVNFGIERRRGTKGEKRRRGESGSRADIGPRNSTTYDVSEGTEREVDRETMLGGGGV